MVCAVPHRDWNQIKSHTLGTARVCIAARVHFCAQCRLPQAAQEVPPYRGRYLIVFFLSQRH